MAVFTIQVDDKASGAAGKIVDSLGGMIKQLQGAGIGIDQLNVKMGGAGKSAGGLRDAFLSAASPTKGLETAAHGLGVALNPVTLSIAAVTAQAIIATAVITGLAVALYKGAQAAIAFAEQRRILTTALDALTDGAGKKSVAALDELGKRLPFTTAEMGEWAKQVAAAGARDLPSLKQGVLAVASSTALLGKQAGQQLIELIQRYRELGDAGAQVKIDRRLARQLAEVGLSMGDLAKQLGKPIEQLNGGSVAAKELGDAIQKAIIGKGKGALADLGNTWDSIKKKFAEGFGFLFEDVQKGALAFMRELRSIAEEFSHGAATASVAKSAIGGVFGALFSIATTALRAVHIGFLRAEILALELAIAIAPAVNWLRRMWAAHDGAGAMLTLLKGTAVVLGIIAAGAALVAAGFALFLGIPIVAIGAVVYAIGWLVTHVGGAVSAVRGFAGRMYSAASDFVAGLVDGIKAGVGRVVNAARDLASGAVNAVRHVLDSHSPSRVMMSVGVDTARGMAIGLDAGASDVERSSAALGGRVAPAVSSTVAPAARGGGSVINLHAELHVTNHGGDGLEVTEQALATLLERLAIQAGLVPAAGATS